MGVGRQPRAAGTIVEGTPAQPAGSGDGRLERRQQQVTPGARPVSAMRHVAVAPGVTAPPVPAGQGRTGQRVQDGVDRGPLLGRRGGTDHVEVHGTRVYGAWRDKVQIAPGERVIASARGRTRPTRR